MLTSRRASDAPSPAARERPVAHRLRAAIFPALILTATVVAGLLEISGSSLGIYGAARGAPEVESGTLAGPARPIRSDEWAVRTPWVLRQSALGFPSVVDGGMGEHDVAVLGDLPVASWEIVLRPHGMPYLLLPIEKALAMEWWLLVAVQALGVYALMLAITGRTLASALGAILVAASPATQWWSVPGAYASIGYGSLGAGTLIAASKVSTRRAAAHGLAAGFAFAAFFATLYVPWQIGTALIVAPAALGAIWSSPTSRSGWLRDLAVATACCSVVVLALFLPFVSAHRDAITTITNTVYPGNNVAPRGGSASTVSLLSAAVDVFAATPRLATVNGTNQSENGAGLALLLPVGLVVFALASRDGVRFRERAPLLGALAGTTIAFVWATLPVPSAVGQLLLLTRAAPGRMPLPIAFGSALCLVLLATRQEVRRLPAWIPLFGAGVFLACQLWAANQYRVDGQPIDLRLATALIAIVAVATFLAVGPRPIVGLAALAAFTLWQASLINPIQRGADPILESELYESVSELATATDGAWLAVGAEATVLATLTAAGVDNVAGVSVYPDYEAWSIIDPDRSSESTWNRYANLQFQFDAAVTDPRIELVGTDSVRITIDPCSRRLDELEIEILVVQHGELSRCAELIDVVEEEPTPVKIYRRRT